MAARAQELLSVLATGLASAPSAEKVSRQGPAEENLGTADDGEFDADQRSIDAEDEGDAHAATSARADAGNIEEEAAAEHLPLRGGGRGG